MGDAKPGDLLLAATPLKAAFRDRHDRRSYDRAKEIARRIVDDPSLVANARQFLERHMRGDAHQARYYELWSALLGRPAREIALALLEDTEEGAELRGSAPVFVVLNPGGPATP